MKIDLDDLERLTMASMDGGIEMADDWAPGHAQTLALIARIRELEVVAERYAGALARESYDEQASEVLALIQKGAVLP